MTRLRLADGFGQLDGRVHPLDGGRSGETFLVEAAGQQGVIRFYGRRPERAAIDHSLLRLVRGLVPVPQVLEARTGVGTADSAGSPPYLLCEHLPGVRLDLLLSDPGTTERVRRSAGGHLGEALARLSGIPFLRAGRFTGPDLAVHPFGDGGLEDWVAEHRTSGAMASLSGAEIDGLLEVAVRAQTLLDGCTRVCLCHHDLAATNVLVDPDTGRLTGLVDWERAHAGIPHADLGRLLRFETDEVFCHAVLRSYAERAPNVRADFLDRAWAADLFTLVELAADEVTGRLAGDAEPVRASELLRRIAVSGRLSGGRPDWLGGTSDQQ